MENLSLSVPDLLQVCIPCLHPASPLPHIRLFWTVQTVKNFVAPDKHEQLDEMLKRYTSKQLGKQQVGP